MGDTDSWEAFGGEYLKAEDYTTGDKYVIVGVESERDQSGKAKMVLTLEKGNIKKKFGCNATNTNTLKAKANSPKDLMGEVIEFNIVDTQKPDGTPAKGMRITFPTPKK